MIFRNILDHTYQPQNDHPFMRIAASIDITSPSRETFKEESMNEFINYILSLRIKSLEEFQNTVLGRYIYDMSGDHTILLSESSEQSVVQHNLLTKAIVDCLINFQIYFSDRTGILSLVIALLTSDIFVNNTLFVDFLVNVLKVNIGSVSKFLLQNYNIPLLTFVLIKLRAFFDSWKGKEEETFNKYFKPLRLDVFDAIFFEARKSQNKLNDSEELKLILAFVYFFLKKNQESIPFEIHFLNRAVNFNEKDINNILLKYATVGGHWSIRMFNVLSGVIQSIASSFGFKMSSFFIQLFNEKFIEEFTEFSSMAQSEIEEQVMSENDRRQLSVLVKNFLSNCKPGKNSLLYQAVEHGNELARSIICTSLKVPSVVGVPPMAVEGGKKLKNIKSKKSKRDRKKNNTLKRRMKQNGGSIVQTLKSKAMQVIEPIKSAFKRSKSAISSPPPVIIDWVSEIMNIQKTLNINIDISVFSQYLETVAKRVKPTSSPRDKIEIYITVLSVNQWLEYSNNLVKLALSDSEKDVSEVFVIRQDGSFKLFYKLPKTSSLQVQVYSHCFINKIEKKAKSNSILIKFSNDRNQEGVWMKLFS